ncbi:MAG TPA: hypothetical protein VF778_06945, partial [Xanthobacteraceae bacterium]
STTLGCAWSLHDGAGSNGARFNGAPGRSPWHAPANMGEAEAGGEPKSSAAPAASPRPQKPASPPQSVNPEQIPN